MVDLIKSMKAFGYKADEKGVCRGVALMAVQACIRKDFETFKKRVDLIHSYNDAETLNKAVVSAEKLRIIDTKGYDLALMSELLQNKPTLGLDNKLYLSDNGDYIFRDQNGTVQQGKLDGTIDLDNLANRLNDVNLKDSIRDFTSKLCDIRPFFEGVELYFQTGKYPELFDSKSKLKLKNDPQNIKIAAPLLAENENEMLPAGNIINCYTRESLPKYLGALRNNIIKNNDDIGLRIASSGHTISLIRQKGKWVLINHDKITKHTDDDACSLDILKSFNNREPFILNIDFYASNSKKIKLASKIGELQNSANDEIKHNVNVVDSGGMTHMYWAIVNDRPELTKLLLDNNFNPNLKNSRNPLSLALELDRTKHLDMLLENKNIKIDVNSPDKDGGLPIYYVGNNKQLDKLIQHGADINKVPDSGNTPLIQAIIDEKSKELIEHLLIMGADSNLASNGSSPLTAAFSMGNRDIINLLIKHRAKAHVSNRINAILLRSAVESNNPDMLDLLTELNINQFELTPSEGSDLLICAASNKNYEMASKLLDINIFPNSLSTDGLNSPLLEAVLNEDTKMIQLLLDKGKADPNFISGETSPLLKAVSLGHVKLVKDMASQYNADLNQYIYADGEDEEEEQEVSSPLLSAMEEEDYDMLNELLKLGADPFKRNKHNISPAHIALYKKDESLINLFMRTIKNENERSQQIERISEDISKLESEVDASESKEDNYEDSENDNLDIEDILEEIGDDIKNLDVAGDNKEDGNSSALKDFSIFKRIKEHIKNLTNDDRQKTQSTDSKNYKR